MFDSNQNNNYGGWAYNPNPQQYQTKQVSSLSAEEYDRLQKQDNPFSLALTETEMLRGICNHRTKDGMGDTLVQNPDGSVECQVCGYRFRPVDTMQQEDVKEACDLITDILQTVKLLYIDMPVQTQREFFQIIPLIGKIPQLFDLAVRNFSKHENYNTWAYKGQNMGTMNLFNMLTGALNGGYAPNYGAQGFGQPQQNMYNPAYGYAPQYQQPQQTVNPNQPVGSVPPMSNGFGYPNGAPNYGPVPPIGGYQPQMQGYQYQPNQPVQPQPYNVQTPPVQQPGATAPAETTAQTDGQTVQAQANFKS